MRRVNVLALAMLVGFSPATSADDARIVFGNGINTDKESAEHSMEKLKEVINSDQRFAGYVLAYNVAYNQTTCIPGDEPGPDLGCLGDIYESVLQELTSVDDESFWAYFYELRSDPAEEFYFVMETANTTAASILSEEDVSHRIEDLAQHVALYRDSIGLETEIVLVAHSQGNYFGNEAYRLLTAEEQANFGMVSVATPTNRVLEDYDPASAPYTTLCEDPIHNIPSSAFSPNISNIVNECGDDSSTIPIMNWIFHGFENSYLAEDSNSLQKITDDIEYVLKSLVEFPPPPPVTDPTIVFSTAACSISTNVGTYPYRDASLGLVWQVLNTMQFDTMSLSRTALNGSVISFEIYEVTTSTDDLTNLVARSTNMNDYVLGEVFGTFTFSETLTLLQDHLYVLLLKLENGSDVGFNGSIGCMPVSHGLGVYDSSGVMVSSIDMDFMPYLVLSTSSSTTGDYSFLPQTIELNDSGYFEFPFMVVRTDSSTEETIYVSTAQNQGYTNNGDYTALLYEPITFAVNESENMVTVRVLGDNEVEGDETFGLIVQDIPDGTVLATATFTIVNNN